MKYNYSNYNTFYIILLFLSNYLNIYSQDILWEKSYGGKNSEYLFDAQPTADYGFILAGSSLSNKTGNKTDNNNGDLDYWVWKMDFPLIDHWLSGSSRREAHSRRKQNLLEQGLRRTRVSSSRGNFRARP